MLRHHQLAWVILVIGLGVILVLTSGFSAPPPVQAWFIEHLAVGPAAFPYGVSVVVSSDTGTSYPRDYLIVANTSETFLYLGAGEPPFTPGDIEFVAAPEQLRSGRIPAFRVNLGKAFVWDRKSNDRVEFGWYPVTRYPPSDVLRLYIFGNRLTADTTALFGYTVVRFVTRNMFDYGGERPTNVQVPSPHDIVLPLEYGTEEINLPLTISYTLNEHYPARQDSGWGNVIVMGILLAALVWLGFKFTGRVWTPTSRGL